ncbi:hypothetical protein ACFGVS_18920 [Mucilaginibacter sp. AW1-7]|uniref:hypothetical protein n=1 Tax=Mucilaginibacter sp. AW1-7 TaxID=3349874 RepID=UPI003F739F7D
MSFNSDKIFTETQKFDSPRAKFIAIILSVVFVAGLAYSLIAPVNSIPAGIGIGLFGGCVIMIMVDTYVFFKSLVIKIDEQGIFLKEKPSKVEILCKWDNIDQVFVRDRFLRLRSTQKNGMGYNLKANNGIQIIFKNGEKIQVGIQNIEEAKQIIEHYLKTEVLNFSN